MTTGEQATIEQLMRRIAELECKLCNQQATTETLLRHHAQVQALVNGSPWAIVTMTADGLIASFNRAAEHLFGYPTETVVGQPVTLLMPERLQAAHQAGLGRYLDTRLAVLVGHTVELVGIRRDGQEILIIVTITAIERQSDVLFAAAIQPVAMRP